MTVLQLSLASGEESLSVRRFSVHEAVSNLFTITVWARSESPFIDLQSIVGKPATLRVDHGVAYAWLGTRYWSPRTPGVPRRFPGALPSR